jgi:hypothetical protein
MYTRRKPGVGFTAEQQGSGVEIAGKVRTREMMNSVASARGVSPVTPA